MLWYSLRAATGRGVVCARGPGKEALEATVDCDEGAFFPKEMT